MRRSCYVRAAMPSATPRLLAAAAALAAPCPALAQAHDAQLWIAGSGEVAVGDGAALSIESYARFGDAADGLYETSVGGFLGAAVGEGVTLSGGYQRVIRYADGDVTGIEQRARQQLAFPIAALGGGKLGGRLRVEQRFRAGQDTGVRARARLQFSWPLGDGAPSLTLSHESFFELNDTDWGQQRGWRRMRNFVGIDLPLVPRVKAQAGYLNQFDRSTGGARDRMAHVLSLSLSAGF